IKADDLISHLSEAEAINKVEELRKLVEAEARRKPEEEVRKQAEAEARRKIDQKKLQEVIKRLIQEEKKIEEAQKKQ
ncbi:hypothetical protein JDS72_29150, partial [Bacillus cereus]|nr:hypothetical protein [Bacillus cereus]